ncbi:RIP metalloprotease RseP [Gorillibacterium massiliense]|uniref:RIP metalloprotease RseP n=1 Tax=Gorillibacterium massiliense TaxID=1280390 RepID=UPI0004B66D0F|nr:RIP metalloprotease RseP [Gorillibacterium massiliense]
METLQIGIQIVLMFFVLVTLHEWGHYFFAKRAGILVREFAIGFGPKLFTYKKGETRYTLRLLPIGGFCRMAGEDPEVLQVVVGQNVGLQLNKDQVTRIYADRFDRLPNIVVGEVEDVDLEKDLFIRLNVDGESIRFPVHPQALTVSQGREVQIAPLNRQYGGKTVGQRALTIFAGPVMNVILAFVLFLIFAFMSGIPTQVKLGDVQDNSPAAKAGLLKGDIIYSANGEAIGTDADKLIKIIQGSPDAPVQFMIERGSEQLQKAVQPTRDLSSDGTKESQPRIGTVLEYKTRTATVGEAFSSSWNDMTFMTKQILIGFKKLVTGDFKMNDLAGPVGTVEFTAQVASAGIAPMIRWSALLSLYLAIFNLLPIPALDGSRLVFIGLEALRGKPIDPNRESFVHFIGFAMLMLLMIAVTYNDILRLIKG